MDPGDRVRHKRPRSGPRNRVRPWRPKANYRDRIRHKFLFKAVGAFRFEAVGVTFNMLGFSFSVLLVSYSYIFHTYSFVSISLANQLFIAYAWVEPQLSLVSHPGSQHLVTSEVDRSLSQDKFLVFACQSSWTSAFGNLRG